MADRPTVLVVDDNAKVRRLQRLALERGGYHVTEAASGFEAVALFGQGQRFDVLIADIGMPGMSGVEMAFTIRTKHRDQKILYVTGQLDRLMNARPLWRGEACLEKPFSIRGLCEAVSLLLYGTLKKPAGIEPSPTSIGQMRSAQRELRPQGRIW
jgi:two-component system, cell cycle sensor histidine kinase and response regulator CckA